MQIQNNHTTQPLPSFKESLSTKEGRARLKDAVSSPSFKLRLRGTAINSLGVALGAANLDSAMVYGAGARGALYLDRDIDWLKKVVAGRINPDKDVFDRTRFATDSSGINSVVLSSAFGLAATTGISKISSMAGHTIPDKILTPAAICTGLVIGPIFGTLMNRYYVKPEVKKQEAIQNARLKSFEYVNKDDIQNKIEKIVKNSDEKNLKASSKFQEFMVEARNNIYKECIENGIYKKHPRINFLNHKEETVAKDNNTEQNKIKQQKEKFYEKQMDIMERDVILPLVYRKCRDMNSMCK